MEGNLIHEKAKNIRDVIRYIDRFKKALVIIYIDDSIMDSQVFSRHIKDICLIHQTGMQVILVPGSSKRINEVLSANDISWEYHNGCRITDHEKETLAMQLIKMAAFDVSNQVMTALASRNKTAVIGNWVRARGKGVVNGFDYGTSGEIDKLETDSIRTVLDNGFIPIFPCIGWSVAGKPYNISSFQLAEQIAEHLHADKLFYLVPDANITESEFSIPSSIGKTTEGSVPALNLEEVDSIISANEHLINSQNFNTNGSVDLTEKVISLLQLSKKACNNQVSRVHILDGLQEGTILCEIYSDFGSGTMIYKNNYGNIRNMTRDDINETLALMNPFIKEGILLPRSKEDMENQLDNYIVYELDGAIKACASLIPYPDGQMEIAGVAVSKDCSNIGIGPKLIQFLVKRAADKKAKRIFLLTTKTTDFFEKLGFKTDSVESIPQERKNKWNPNRGSKVMVLETTAF